MPTKVETHSHRLRRQHHSKHRTNKHTATRSSHTDTTERDHNTATPNESESDHDHDEDEDNLDSLEVPSHWANEHGTAFKNPWPSAQIPSLHEMWSGGFIVGWAKPRQKLESDRRARELEVVKPDWGEAKGATARGGRGDRFTRTSNDGNNGNNARDGSGGKLMMGTWLGHAGAFVEMPWGHDGLKRHQNTFKMLFDPIFSGRAGPTAYTGPARYRPSPCEVEDLPGCDALFISHNHYDHLDLSSIQAVLDRFPDCKYFVPLGKRSITTMLTKILLNPAPPSFAGNKSWFTSTGIPADNIFEMDWWENVELTPQDVGQILSTTDTSSTKTLSNASSMRITCVPAQHNSGRTGIDSGSTLWCGWVVEHFIETKDQPSSSSSNADSDKGDKSKAATRTTRRGALYFAGDTGYRRHRMSKAVCPAFKADIGDKYGPFDLSFIPIWRGGSLGFVSWLGLRLHHENIPSGLHGSPTDAVSIHLETRSRNTIGVHFGTFIGAENESLEAIIELNEACTSAGISQLEDELPHDGDKVEKGRMGVIDLGETIVVEIEDIVVC
ncbi:Protein-lysine N-methyltransferase efm4 [Microbotryomycetes sp. JL221]|nr:Protein-lysine N-methyltransferase efm4 [Microbotryomycetes sp. JL221]